MTFERVANCVSKLRRELRFFFFNVLGIVCTKHSDFHPVHAGLSETPQSFLQPISMEIKASCQTWLFLSYTCTHTHHNTTQQGKHAGMWKFTEQNPGIKNRDGCRMYKYGGGSEDLSTCGRLIRTLAVSRGAPAMEAEVKTPECSGGRRRKLNQRR